jgi:hypothetical protein
MKQHVSIGLLMVCFALASAQAQPVPAKKNPANQATIREVELRCRGGGNMAVTGDPQIVMQDPNGGWGKMKVQFMFGHSSTPANNRGGGVDPGTCAWGDRTMRPEEPSTISVLTGNPTLQFLGGTPTELPGYPTFKEIRDHLSSDKGYWSFFGARSGQSFRIDRHHATLPPGIYGRINFNPPAMKQPLHP